MKVPQLESEENIAGLGLRIRVEVSVRIRREVSGSIENKRDNVKWGCVRRERVHQATIFMNYI